MEENKEIQKVNLKLEELFKKATESKKYQYFLAFLFLIQFSCSQFFNQGLPYLEGRPFIFLNNSNISQQLTHDICNTFNGSYSIDESIKLSSIVIDFKIYCDEIKISLIGLFFYGGLIIGTCTIYLLADKIGRKRTLIIFVPLQILFLVLFRFIKPGLSKYSLIFLYGNLFFIGYFSYSIIVVIIIYICEIVKKIDIPIFLTIIVTGMPISGFISFILFTYSSIDWKNILTSIGAVNFILYIIMHINMVGSPIFFLNNGKYTNFIKCMIKLSKKNGNSLSKKDFNFLSPYMPIKERRKTFQIWESDDILNDSFSSKEDINEKLFSLPLITTRNDVTESLKEEYLENDKENKDSPFVGLFQGLKMKDYSPIDLFRFQELKINFLLLSYLWEVSIIIKNGINLAWKHIPEYKDHYIWTFVSLFFVICFNYLIYHIYKKENTNFHILLVSLNLFIFVSLIFCLYFCQNITIYIILILFTKVICYCMYLLLLIITSLIYPNMIRTKGLGFNLAAGSFGAIIIIFLVEYLELEKCILYYLSFEFFSLMLSFGLPKKIDHLVFGFLKENTKTQNIDKDYDEEYSKVYKIEKEKLLEEIDKNKKIIVMGD